MTTSMYCLYVGFDYTYIDVNALAQGIKSFLASLFFFFFFFLSQPLLGLEPMAPIRPQLLVSHANHSATETSICICMYMYICMCMYVCMYVYVCIYVCVCMYVYMYVCIMYVYVHECMYVCMYVYVYMYVYVCMYVFIYVCVCMYE